MSLYKFTHFSVERLAISLNILGEEHLPIVCVKKSFAFLDGVIINFYNLLKTGKQCKNTWIALF